jgi:hypothetical protein
VDIEGDTGWGPSAAFDPDGNLSVLFRDLESKEVVIAKYE